jgi:hypothetical protein
MICDPDQEVIKLAVASTSSSITGRSQATSLVEMQAERLRAFYTLSRSAADVSSSASTHQRSFPASSDVGDAAPRWPTRITSSIS